MLEFPHLLAALTATLKIRREIHVSLDFIQSCIKDDMLAVDAVIRRSLHSEVVLVNQVADYIINSGGKRLRPALVLLSAGAFGQVTPVHHQLSATSSTHARSR